MGGSTRPNHTQGDASKLHWSELRADGAVTSSIEESKVHWSELPVIPTNSETLAELELQVHDAVISSIEESKVHWSELPVDPPDSETPAELELEVHDAVTSSTEESKVHSSELSVDSTDSEILEELEIQERNRTSWKALQQHNPFFFQDWNEKVNVGQLIAEGGQAEIYEATWKDEQYSRLPEGIRLPKEMVVKVFKLDGCSLDDFSAQWPRISSISNTVLHGEFLSKLEMNIDPFTEGNMNRLQSKYAVQIVSLASISSIHRPQYICPIVGAYVLKEKRFAFLMQRYKYDLRTFIDIKMRENEGYGPPLPGKEIHVLQCIAKGMEWLHEQGVLHRDLKSSNVLVRKEYWREFAYVVSDFECSMSTIGTGFWRAPEVLQELRDPSGRKREDIWTTKSDVYSFGILCFEVLTGGFPFAQLRSKKDWDEIIDHDKRPVLPDYVDPELQQMVKRCWDRDPQKRPSFADIVLELTRKRRNMSIEAETEI